ncbi:MAG: Uma2 family endonuclease [Sporichthyaceae bacterium]
MSVHPEAAVLPERYLNEGPWTEADYFDLPEDIARIELLDGALLVNPPPTVGHQRLTLRLAMALAAVCPSGLEVVVGAGVRLITGRIFIPDIAVVVSHIDGDARVFEARDVRLALEIVSPGSVALDRAVKPPLYAESGIATYVRIEKAGPTAHVLRLHTGKYVPESAGTSLRLEEPFPAVVDLPELLTEAGS